ncbi:hypothetical protein REPUB_Repub02eG0090600 [Reevesia pubescens]
MKEEESSIYRGAHGYYLWVLYTVTDTVQVHFPGFSYWNVFGEILEKTNVLTVPSRGFGPAEEYNRVGAFGQREFIALAMATPGYDLAEVYVMRKVHKEGIQRKKEERAKTEEIDFAVKQSSGCFSSFFKKIHPRQASTLKHEKNEVKSCDHNKG